MKMTEIFISIKANPLAGGFVFKPLKKMKKSNRKKSSDPAPVENAAGINEFLTIAGSLEELCAPSKETEMKILDNLKHMFDESVSHSTKQFGPFDSLIVEGMDADSIWEEIACRNRPLTRHVQKKLAHLLTVTRKEKTPAAAGKSKSASKKGNAHEAVTSEEDNSESEIDEEEGDAEDDDDDDEQFDEEFDDEEDGDGDGEEEGDDFEEEDDEDDDENDGENEGDEEDVQEKFLDDFDAMEEKRFTRASASAAVSAKAQQKKSKSSSSKTKRGHKGVVEVSELFFFLFEWRW